MRETERERELKLNKHSEPSALLLWLKKLTVANYSNDSLFCWRLIFSNIETSKCMRREANWPYTVRVFYLKFLLILHLLLVVVVTAALL